jgi:AcrR family transcriptional regulator
VARVHLERDGFQAANIRAIAEEAGVAPGTVLLHFTDKLGLLHAALHDDLEEAIDRSLSTRSRGSLLRCLTAVVRPFYAYYAARPSLSKTLLRESLLAESPWRERFSEQLMRVNAHVVSMVEKAKSSGELAPTTRADIFATAFFSFYYMVLIAWVQGGIAEPLPLFKMMMAQHITGSAGSSPEAR